MGKEFVYTHSSTVAGGEQTLAAGKLGGFVVNGSAGSATLSIYDGTVLLITTSAGANQHIAEVWNAPIACRTSILGTCSGTGFYSILITT